MRLKTSVLFLCSFVSINLIFIIIIMWFIGGILSASANKPIGAPPPDIAGTAVQFPSLSGSLIHGWLLPGEKGAGTIILLHSVRSDRRSMLGRARFLSRLGYSVLLFDFQAHGESIGDKITFGYLESRDVQSAVTFIKEKKPGEKVGVIGASLGGAAALLASPALPVDAMVLEMVYPTIEEAVNDRVKMWMGDWDNDIFATLLLLQFKPRLGVSLEQLRPIERVNNLKIPKLFIAGSEDRHTTLAESKRIFQTASEPKEMWVIEGLPHTDFHAQRREEYEGRVLKFFAHIRNLK